MFAPISAETIDFRIWLSPVSNSQLKASLLSLTIRSSTSIFWSRIGAAWRNIQTSATCQHSPPDPFCGVVAGTPISTGQNTFTQLGWTAGIGVDWRVSGNWIARGEYRYAQFGSDGLLNLSVPTNTSTIGYRLRTSSNIATLGIAYQFGGPVVAKY